MGITLFYTLCRNPGSRITIVGRGICDYEAVRRRVAIVGGALLLITRASDWLKIFFEVVRIGIAVLRVPALLLSLKSPSHYEVG